MARSPVVPAVLAALLVGCTAPGYKNFPWNNGDDNNTTGTSSTGGSSSDDASTGTSGTADSSGSDSASTSTSTSSTDPPVDTTSTTTLDPSSTTSTTDLPSVCSDGLLDPGEECDDGNRDPADGCNDLCARDRRVFVTSQVFQPWMVGGAKAADGICRQLAGQAMLPNWQSYIAWISDSTLSVADRLYAGKGRYLRIDGAVVADDLAGLLAGPLKAPIRVDQLGGVLDGGGAWTGTNPDGTAAVGLMCEDWVMTDDFMLLGQWGSTQATDSKWTQMAPEPCFGSSHMYCIEGK